MTDKDVDHWVETNLKGLTVPRDTLKGGSCLQDLWRTERDSKVNIGIEGYKLEVDDKTAKEIEQRNVLEQRYNRTEGDDNYNPDADDDDRD